MSKTVLGVAVALLVVAGVIFWMNQPEPTPAERLDDAVAATGAALKDAASAVSDGVSDKSAEMRRSAEEGMADLAETIAGSTEEFSAEVVRLMAQWQDAEILTPEGMNFDKAIASVEASSLTPETKARLVSILTEIRAAPETFDQYLAEMKTLLKEPG